MPVTPTVIREIMELNDLEDLRRVQEAVSIRWNEIQRRAALSVKATLKVGDLVAWEPRRRGYPSILRGKVTALKNTKAIVFESESRTTWRIPLTMLKKEDSNAGQV